jgi:hypothetical protein
MVARTHLASPDRGGDRLFVWLGALIVGMTLRFVSGGGVQLSFVIVAGMRARRVPGRLAGRLKLIRRAVPRSAG